MERDVREERAPHTGSRTQLRLQVAVRPAEPLLKGRGTTEVSRWSLPVLHPIPKELRAGGRSQLLFRHAARATVPSSWSVT